MHSIGQNRTNTEDGRKSIGSGAEMCHRTQILEGMLLFLYRKIRFTGTVYDNVGCFDLQRLTRRWRKHHISLHDQAGRNVLFFHGVKIVKAAVKHHLNIFLAGTVVQLNKAKILRRPYRANPTGNGNMLFLHGAVYLFYKIRFHFNTSFCICIRYYTPKTRDLSNH